jgi:hypothetical protein
MQDLVFLNDLGQVPVRSVLHDDTPVSC